MSSRPAIIGAAAASAAAVAGLGALSTELGPWYYALQKPSWQPPDWLFGPAWTLIFALCALSAIFYWHDHPGREDRMRALAAFAANAFFNLTWSLLFFRLKRPDWALYEVGFLWLSILVLMVLLSKGSRRAAWLLLPYLAWVSFAAVLNWKIVQLNAPLAGV